VTTQADIDSLLRLLDRDGREQLISRSVTFEGKLGDDSTDFVWGAIPEESAQTLRAAVRLGLVREDFVAWETDDSGNPRPGGGDYVVELTGAGTERLMKLNEPLLRRAVRQISSSVFTIGTSVAISVLVAYALFYWGPK